MNIVIDARESGTSTGRYIDKLVEYLHVLQPKHQITVLAKKHRLAHFRQVAPGFTVIEAPYKEFTFEEQIGLKDQLEGLKPDLVHFGMVQQPVWYKGKTVTTIHDLTTMRFRNPAKNPLIYVFKQQVYKWVIKRAARKSTKIITPTEFVKLDVQQYTHVPAKKITVTLEAADKITEPPAAFEQAESKQYLLYVGRPQPHKNLERLLEAFAKVKQADRPDLHLVLAGKFDAAYAKLRKKAEKEGITNVIFTGWVNDGQLRWLYEHAEAYVFPSLSEGFGLPPLEAMHYGLPVISSNATCLPEVNGDAAAYFDPLDTDAMAATILTVLNDKKLRTELAKRGTKQVAKYSWKRMAEQTLAVYQSALK